MKLRLNILMIVLAALILIGGALRPSEATPQRAYPEVGYQAPPFAVFDEAGRPVSLSDYEGQALFLNFWASWCPPCKAEAPEIHQLNQRLPDGSALLTINWTATEASPEAASRWMAGEQLAFPLALDPRGEAAQAYQVVSLPTSFFISPSGLITAKVTGPMSEATMRHYLAQAETPQAGFQPTPPPIWPLTFQQAALVGLGGLVVAYVLTTRRAPSFGLTKKAADDLFFTLAMGAFVGSRTLYLLREPGLYLKKPWNLLILARGDLTLPGALVGLTLMLLWLGRAPAGRRQLAPFAAACLAPLALGLAPYLATQGQFGGLIAAAGAATLGLLLYLSPAPWPAQLALGSLGLATATILTLYFLPGTPLAGGVTWVQLGLAGLGLLAWKLGKELKY